MDLQGTVSRWVEASRAAEGCCQAWRNGVTQDQAAELLAGCGWLWLVDDVVIERRHSALYCVVIVACCHTVVGDTGPQQNRSGGTTY